MVKVVQKALTEGRWEMEWLERKKRERKHLLRLPRTPCTEASSESPQPSENVIWWQTVKESETLQGVRAKLRTTQIKSERRRATQTGSFGIPLPVHSKRIPNAYFFHVRICLALISKAHSACQDNFHSSPGHPAIERFHSRKRKHTLRPM